MYIYVYTHAYMHAHTHAQEVGEHTRLGNQEAEQAEQAEAPSQQPEAGLLLRPFPLPPPRGLGMR